MSSTAEDHWIWDGMVLDHSQESDFLDGLLKLSHGINNGQHPTTQKRADRPRPIRFFMSSIRQSVRSSPALSTSLRAKRDPSFGDPWVQRITPVGK